MDESSPGDISPGPSADYPIVVSPRTANKIMELVSNSQSQASDIENNMEITPGEVNRSTSHSNRKSNISVIPKLYNSIATGPFEVYVQYYNKSLPEERKTIHPMLIGKILKKAGINGIKALNPKGRSRTAVIFNCAKNANNFLNNAELEKNNLMGFIPAHLVSCQGVVRHIHPSLQEEEILNNLQSPAKVLQIRRLNRRVTEDTGVASYKPTASVIVTFEGTALPKKVCLFFTPLEVDVYKYPVTQCLKCLHFGHIARQCKGKDACSKCSGNHNKSQCTSLEIKCIHCGNKHEALDRTCPEYIRQKRIKEVMAFQNLSFSDAVKLANPNQNFSSHPKDFPPLNTPKANHSPELTVLTQIPITTTTQSIPIKRKRFNFTQHFSKKEHDKNLFYPNGRDPEARSRFSLLDKSNNRFTQQDLISPTTNYNILPNLKDNYKTQLPTVQEKNIEQPKFEESIMMLKNQITTVMKNNPVLPSLLNMLDSIFDLLSKASAL